MSAARRLGVSLLLLVSMLFTAPAYSQQQQQDPASLWADFNHYVLIARPDLAQAAGQALLQQVDNSRLLDIVEASNYRDNYDRTLIRAGKMDTVQDVASQIEKRIQQARIDRSREPERIARDIQALAEGQRPYRNAVARLRGAGQYAAPQMLAALENKEQEQLHPYVMSAMVVVGRPLVYPLSVALPEIAPSTQRQVAQVLAELGYVEATPYLKLVIEDADTDPDARRVLERAYQQLMQRAERTGNPTAADLYLSLGQTQYTAGSSDAQLANFDPAQGKGIVWEYTQETGLVPVPVPGQIYADVRAMRSARQALNLKQDMDPALSLWLMSNLRRENRLAAGEVDPSHPQGMREAQFYAMLAGPLRLHDVLARALHDRDAALALDAIDALARTAGTDALVNRNAGRQPLIEALSYPDRRVRFRAAEALANAKPEEDFSGAFRVVPVLAEAIRQSDTRYALVIADDQQRLNELMATAGELGYEAFGGLSLQDVSEELNLRPAVDLVITSQPAPAIARLFRDSASNYKLAATPVLAVASPGQQYEVRERIGEQPRLTFTTAEDSQQVRSAIEQLTEARADQLDAQESEQIALTGLQILHEIALGGGSDVYDVRDALPALTQALRDERPNIITRAGQVLSLIGEPKAQAAVAQAALNASSNVQVELLRSLGQSATYFGNLIEERQTNNLLNLVRTSSGETAIAAAEAHGALTLPTSNAVKMILQ